MSQADFIDLVTERRSLGQAVIRHKDGTPLPIFYVLIPSQVSELPCYIALLWQQTADVPRRTAEAWTRARVGVVR